jgi:prepilin-type N-terminal cleavage/methylation domain-containing protein
MRKKRTIRGFTLAELLVAAAILALAVTGLLQLLIVCLLSNTANNNLAVAVNDAQYMLETVKGLPYSSVSACTFPAFSFTNLADEQVSSPTCTNENKMTKVTVGVTWKERNAPKSFQLSTRIAE